MTRRARVAAVTLVALFLPTAATGQEVTQPPLPDPVVGFSTVRAAARREPDRQGLLLPLRNSDAIRLCLPLTSPCVDPATSLAFVRASDYEIVWQQEAGAGNPVAPVGSGFSFGPLGRPPSAVSNQTFAVPVLDVTGDLTVKDVPAKPVGGALQTGIDSSNSLSAVLVGEVPVSRSVAPPSATPFDPPMVVSIDRLAVEETVLVASVSGPEPQPLFGIVRPSSWTAVDSDLVALLPPGALPRLVRITSTSMGLFVPLPDGAVLPDTAADDGGGVLGLSSGILGLLGLLAVGNAGLALLLRYRRALRRRWRRRRARRRRSRSVSAKQSAAKPPPEA